MPKRIALLAAGALVVGSTVVTGVGASAAVSSVAGAASVTGQGHPSPPITYSDVPAPISPDKPGHGPASTVVYPPATIQSAYGFSSPSGSGATIAVVVAYGDPSLTNDVATFDTKYGIPAATLTSHVVDGGPSTTNRSWAIETALDVEWAHANAPAAAIDVVVTPDNTFQHLLDGVAEAVSLHPTAVSMSWGVGESNYALSNCTEPGHSSVTDTCLNLFEAQFQSASSTSFFSASGDNGAYDGTHPKRLTVEYPASSPEVVGVGGTTLNVDSSGNWSSETGWSGSGGGVSTLFTNRDVPDVAFDADTATAVYVYAGGRWYGVGGTSVGAPNWAAIAADSGKTVTPSSVAAAAGANYSGAFHDIQSGSNGFYNAGPGDDEVTGWGSPKVGGLLSAL